MDSEPQRTGKVCGFVGALIKPLDNQPALGVVTTCFYLMFVFKDFITKCLCIQEQIYVLNLLKDKIFVVPYSNQEQLVINYVLSVCLYIKLVPTVL